MVTLNNASLLKNANYLAEQTKACRGKPVFLPRKVCLNNASLLKNANPTLMLSIPNSDALHCNRSIILAEIRRLIIA